MVVWTAQDLVNHSELFVIVPMLALGFIDLKPDFNNL
jgi:hypothetical protein